jgi:hypothetical protein
MKPSIAPFLLALSLALTLVAPDTGLAQSVEERLTRIEKRLERIERLLEIMKGGAPTAEPDGKSITVSNDPFSWVANPNTGKIIRSDSRNGDVSVIHTGPAGKWEAIRGEPFVWLFSSGGSVIRLDTRNGDNTKVFTGKPGSWELLGKKDSPFVVLTNSDTGAVLRLDKRNGDTTIIDRGK